MKKLLLIMNPCSGKKKAAPALADIIAIFNRAGYDISTYMTAARGDGTRVAAERSKDYDILLCIGGDGTFNEIVSGLCAAGSRTPIAYIPAGSTNDFASSLKLSKDLRQAAHDIVAGTPRPLDIGRFNDRYFSYIASFGVFTRTSYATPQSLKNVLGHFAYILSGVKELTSLRTQHLRFCLDDGRIFEDDYIFGAISNSTSVAGILTLADELVDMNDGQFEVLLIRKPRDLMELNKCVLALMAQNYNTPMVTLASASRVEIDAPQDMDWTLDGEQADGAAHCVVENLHSAVNVIVNSRPEKEPT